MNPLWRGREGRVNRRRAQPQDTTRITGIGLLQNVARQVQAWQLGSCPFPLTRSVDRIVDGAWPRPRTLPQTALAPVPADIVLAGVHVSGDQVGPEQEPIRVAAHEGADGIAPARDLAYLPL